MFNSLQPSFSRQLHSGTNGVNRAKQNEGDDDIKRVSGLYSFELIRRRK
jgi:hypothetical protein